MTFRCEDLREHGLILVPNTSPEYDPLLEDIQRRIENPPPGMAPDLYRMWVGTVDAHKRETSAILLNQSGKTIVAMEVVWSNEQTDGRVITATRSWNDAVGRRPSSRMDYWRHILSGSKRYIGEGRLVGDNSDVRGPEPEEIPKGGGSGSGGGRGQSRQPIVSVTLALTGVFFPGGEFAGSETSNIWQRAVARVGVWREIADLLREDSGFERVETLTGTIAHIPPPRDVRAHELWSCAQTVARHRELFGDAGAIERLISYVTTELPEIAPRIKDR
jgi:hypothetical protein